MKLKKTIAFMHLALLVVVGSQLASAENSAKFERRIQFLRDLRINGPLGNEVSWQVSINDSMASLMIMDLEPRPGSGVDDLSPEELMAKFDQLIASGDIIFTLSVSRRYVEIASDSMFLETSRHEVIHMTDYMLPEAVPIVHSEWNPFASEVDFFDLLTKRAAFQLFTELRAYSDGSANDYRDLELLASPLAGPESLNARLELIHKSWVERLPVATQNLLASLKRTNHEAWWAMLNNIYAETFTLFEKYGYQPDPRVQGVSCQFRLKFQGL